LGCDWWITERIEEKKNKRAGKDEIASAVVDDLPSSPLAREERKKNMLCFLCFISSTSKKEMCQR